MRPVNSRSDSAPLQTFDSGLGGGRLTLATLFGKPLPGGGTIGVASPATGVFRRSDVERGIEWWRSQGCKVKLSEGVFQRLERYTVVRWGMMS